MKKIITLSAIAFFLAVGSSFAQQPGANSFFRLELRDYSNQGEPTEVNLRLPLSLLNAMAPTINEALSEAETGGHFNTIRLAWEDIRNSDPFTLVEIESEDGNLNVSTTENFIQVSGDSLDSGVFTAKIPFELGDLLFAENGTLTVETLIASLESMRGTELVNIDAENLKLTAWIE